MIQKTILTFSLLFIVGIALAQDPFPSNTIGAPIDGGLSLLLAAGAAYGAKKVYEFRNKDNQDEDKEIK